MTYELKSGIYLGAVDYSDVIIPHKMTYKGTTIYDEGMYYCPYIPLMQAHVTYTPKMEVKTVTVEPYYNEANCGGSYEAPKPKYKPIDLATLRGLP